MNLIGDLKPFKTMWRVKVKIIRLWRQYTSAGGETIEMVFCDARGDKIHGTVKKDEVGQIIDKLEQGQTKVIINFTVNHAAGSYRSTKHMYKVVFLPTTRLRKCESLPECLTGLEPVNFQDVLNGLLKDEFLIDVVGQVVEVSHVETVSVNGKDTQKVVVELRDQDDVRLPLVLWGKFTQDISDAIQLRSENKIVCVVRFGKIKKWKDERSISNAYNVSDVAINPDMNEVIAFMRLLPKDDVQLAIVDQKPLKMVSGVSERDDFSINTPRKTISEVLASRETEKCIVMASIAAIDCDMGWFYLSCNKCAKKVFPVPNENVDDDEEEIVAPLKFYCSKCKTYSPKLLPRYKLHMVVLDNTSNCKFLLFDNLALQLLHQPCIELTGSITNEMHDPSVLPPIINNLVGKTFLFKIGIERENYVYKYDTYKVQKIITDTSMITEWDSTHSPTGSENDFGGSGSVLSEAPEESLMLHGGSSQLSDYLTPAKRSAPPSSIWRRLLIRTQLQEWRVLSR